VRPYAERRLQLGSKAATGIRCYLSNRGTGPIAKVTSIPVVRSAAGAIIGAYLARLGAKQYVRRKFGDEMANDPEYFKNLRRAATLVGALAGGANPWLREAGSNDYMADMFTPHVAGSEVFDPSPFFGTVGKDDAIDVLNSDLYLRPYERRSVIGLVGEAPEVRPGTTSSFGLVQSALRAGINFIPAYAFGQMAGRMLGLSKDTAKNMSRLGALAYAVRASGITEHL